jgi:hypothetical protein
MARLIFFLTALLLAIPAVADDDNRGRSGEKKALQADCERQANQRNLIGKERKNFVKECTKEGKRAKRRYEKPAAAQPAQPAAQPATPAAPPPTTAPTQPAATPASPPPAATPQPPNPVLTTEQKRQKCTEEVIRDKVPPALRESFIKKCMQR